MGGIDKKQQMWAVYGEEYPPKDGKRPAPPKGSGGTLEERLKALDELTKQAQELDMGY